MENAAHTLAGLALARLGLDRYGPPATIAAVAASNLPDIDIVGYTWGGQPWYLCHHRGVTHALAGIAIEGVLLGVLVWWCTRRRFGSSLPVLVAVSWAGLLLHLGMDALNNYGVRPWLPFDGTWYYGDLVYIVDPWLWITLGAAACLGSPGRGRGWPWLVFYAVAASALWSSHRVGWPVAALFSAAAIGVCAARFTRSDQRRRRLWCVAGVVVAAAYLAVLAGFQHRSHQLVRDAEAALTAGEAVDRRSAAARPGVPWRFRVFLQTETNLHYVDADAWTGAVEEIYRLPRNMDDPGIEAARGTAEHHAWRVFARHPFTGRDGGDLILGDGRYSWRPSEGWSNLRVPASASSAPRAER